MGGAQFDPLRFRGRDVIGRRPGRDPVNDVRHLLSEEVEQHDRERGLESAVVVFVPGWHPPLQKWQLSLDGWDDGQAGGRAAGTPPPKCVLVLSV